MEEKEVISILETTTQHGAIEGKTQTNPTNFYNLDAIIAVGTILDLEGPVIINIRKNKPFYGTVDILGDMYETGYEPIKNCDRKIIGIYYTGFQLEK